MENQECLGYFLTSQLCHDRHRFGPIRPFKLASEMWKHLLKVYTQYDYDCEFELEHEISEYQQDDKDIHSFCSGLIAIWSEQDMYLSSTVSASALLEVMKECKKARVVQFLMKLRQKLENIQPNIFNRKQLQNCILSFLILFKKKLDFTHRHLLWLLLPLQ